MSDHLHEEFFEYLDRWHSRLASLKFSELVEKAGGPDAVGIFCVDLINGFCHEGPLQSDRVRKIIRPIVTLFETAYTLGVRKLVLPQDTHDPAAAEFISYPPHCIRGTSESATVNELANLGFASSFKVFPKNSIHSAVETGLNSWLDQHSEVKTFIVVGDCTDLCTYHLALHLKFRANASNQVHRIVLPANCVDTYDVPVNTAEEIGIPAHPAEVFHPLFLYSMAMNGVEVVKTLD